jgi:hypothetical protein
MTASDLSLMAGKNKVRGRQMTSFGATRPALETDSR